MSQENNTINIIKTNSNGLIFLKKKNVEFY